MHVVEIVGRGGPEHLHLREKPDVMPGPGQVRVAVKATGVNFADILGRQGLYPDAPKGDFVPGYEIAGTIDAIGADTDRFAIGDRVMGITKFHGYASQVVTPETHLMRIPEGWDFVRAAAVPTVYLTAYMALILQARLRKGDRLLIHGAAGGVGIAAIQFARHIGADIVGTCGSPAKVAFLREQGVRWPMNYNDEPFDKFVRREVGKLDCILDPQGGETTQQGRRLLAHGGRLILYGIASASTGRKRNLISMFKTVAPLFTINPLRLMKNNSGMFGLNLLRVWNDVPCMTGGFDYLKEAMLSGVIDPIIDSTFPLAKAGEAHGRLESRGNIGKVVLTVD